MTAIKTVCIVLAICLSTLVTIVIVRTIALTTHRQSISPCTPSDLDFIEVGKGSKRLKRFQDALRFQKVSTEPGNYNTGELERFLQFILSGNTLSEVWS